MTSGILKNVGNEAAIAAEQGLVDVLSQTAGMAIYDARLLAKAFGWERIFSVLDRI